MFATQPDIYDLQRRGDGAILVRVHSRDRQGRKLPDAVFTFRWGDPQYDYWAELLQMRETNNLTCQPPVAASYPATTM